MGNALEQGRVLLGGHMTSWKLMKDAPRNGRPVLLWARLKSVPADRDSVSYPIVGFWLRNFGWKVAPEILNRYEDVGALGAPLVVGRRRQLPRLHESADDAALEQDGKAGAMQSLSQRRCEQRNADAGEHNLPVLELSRAQDR